MFYLFSRILCSFIQNHVCSLLTCNYPLFHSSLSLFLFPFALFPSPLLFHNPFARRLSNKSHLIVHFLSWPGAWCQTSCMKCSFTAFPASTFVQRKNNKKSHRASWTLWGFFFSFFLKRRRNSSWFIVCFTAMSLKRNSATISCRYTRRPFFLVTEKVMFLSGFYGLLL